MIHLYSFNSDVSFQALQYHSGHHQPSTIILLFTMRSTMGNNTSSTDNNDMSSGIAVAKSEILDAAARPITTSIVPPVRGDPDFKRKTLLRTI
jgi:hypothetical protein